MKLITSIGIEPGCGMTTSSIMIALTIAKYTSNSVCYITTGDSYRDIENMFSIKKNEDPLKSPEQLVNLVSANQLKKEDVRDYATKVLGLVDLLPLYAEDEDTLSLVLDLCKVLDYQLVIVDAGSNLKEKSLLRVLDETDIVLFNTSQRKKSMEALKKIVSILEIDTKTFNIITKFDNKAGDYKSYDKLLRNKFALTGRFPYNHNFIKMEGNYEVLFNRIQAEYEGFYGVKDPINDTAKTLVQLTLGELHWGV